MDLEKMWMPERFDTERLKLRTPVHSDAVPIFEQYAQDTEVTKYLTWQPHKNIDETKQFLQRCVDVWKQGLAFPYSIIRKIDQKFLGMIEMVDVDTNGINIGYVLAKQYWGNGYAAEALKIIIDWGLQQKDIYRIWAVCDVGNPASARVLEKAGMQKEGILRKWIKLVNISQIPRDCHCYSIVKTDFA